VSRILCALVLFVAAASACSSSEVPEALSLRDEAVLDEALLDEALLDEAQTSTAAANEIDRSSTSLAMTASTTDVPTPTTEAVATSTTETTSTSTPADAVSTSAPGDQSAAPSGTGSASADDMRLYVGALGFYTVDQGLATSPVAMPTVGKGIAPLTGLPSSRSTSGAIVVKIDNSPKARPQAGLDVADVVIEQEVEGGITRLAAIFQSSAPERIGPVRSARSTDISFLSALGRPGLVYSGANDVFDTLIIGQEQVRNYSASRFGGYWRDTSRRAPSNLYTSMSQFSMRATPPPAWFHFGAGSTNEGAATSSFVVNFPSTSITWTWNGIGWDRAQDGRNHTSESGAVLQATNVVVAQVAVVDSGLKDPTGAVVPEFVWAGEGPAAVFTNGRRIDGRWIRPTLADPAVLVDAAGGVIELAPGSTWVELTRGLP